jgi:tRNA threonylcarbamoyladenosine biosynthesis protein TsaE
MEIKINSVEETKKFAGYLARCLKGKEVILLKGNLAAGKTTFVRFLVSSLDPSLEDEVNSPTFTVMNQYETEKFPIFHIDLYRVKDFDFTDFLGEGIIIIEWAEDDLFETLEDVPVIFIKIKTLNDQERIFNIKYKNADYITDCIRPFLKKI